jgi:AraC-like DNA-binding protein
MDLPLYRDEGWTLVDVPDIDTLPRPVWLRAQDLPPRHVFPMHVHPWNQFVYATAGTLTVTVDDSWYVITPEQAIWVPTGVEHTTGARHGANFRNLYVADAPDLAMPRECTLFSVSPLLRALIVELQDLGDASDDSAYLERIDALVLAQLQRLKVEPLQLPWPRNPMLHRICEALYDAPADTRSLEDWGRELGASPRTLTRRFERDLGISLREWRHRLRLFLSLERLCAGGSVTRIALELGYASPAAFTCMFRRNMGCSPSEWRGRHRPGMRGTGA